MDSISSYGPRTASLIINFTSTNGQTMNMSHTIKLIVFLQGINISRNTGDYNISVGGQFISSNNYTIFINTSGNTTISYVKLSYFIFDQTLYQATSINFMDADILTSTNTIWSQLSLPLVWETKTNFMVGLVGIAYKGTGSVSFYYN